MPADLAGLTVQRQANTVGRAVSQWSAEAPTGTRALMTPHQTPPGCLWCPGQVPRWPPNAPTRHPTRELRLLSWPLVPHRLHAVDTPRAEVSQTVAGPVAGRRQEGMQHLTEVSSAQREAIDEKSPVSGRILMAAPDTVPMSDDLDTSPRTQGLTRPGYPRAWQHRRRDRRLAPSEGRCFRRWTVEGTADATKNLGAQGSDRPARRAWPPDHVRRAREARRSRARADHIGRSDGAIIGRAGGGPTRSGPTHPHAGGPDARHGRAAPFVRRAREARRSRARADHIGRSDGAIIGRAGGGPTRSGPTHPHAGGPDARHGRAAPFVRRAREARLSRARADHIGRSDGAIIGRAGGGPTRSGPTHPHAGGPDARHG